MTIRPGQKLGNTHLSEFHGPLSYLGTVIGPRSKVAKMKIMNSLGEHSSMELNAAVQEMYK
jgi:hypothetical protein